MANEPIQRTGNKFGQGDHDTFADGSTVSRQERLDRATRRAAERREERQAGLRSRAGSLTAVASFTPGEISVAVRLAFERFLKDANQALSTTLAQDPGEQSWRMAVRKHQMVITAVETAFNSGRLHQEARALVGNLSTGRSVAGTLARAAQEGPDFKQRILDQATSGAIGFIIANSLPLQQAPSSQARAWPEHSSSPVQTQMPGFGPVTGKWMEPKNEMAKAIKRPFRVPARTAPTAAAQDRLDRAPAPPRLQHGPQPNAGVVYKTIEELARPTGPDGPASATQLQDYADKLEVLGREPMLDARDRRRVQDELVAVKVDLERMRVKSGVTPTRPALYKAAEAGVTSRRDAGDALALNSGGSIWATAAKRPEVGAHARALGLVPSANSPEQAAIAVRRQEIYDRVVAGRLLGPDWDRAQLPRPVHGTAGFVSEQIAPGRLYARSQGTRTVRDGVYAGQDYTEPAYDAARRATALKFVSEVNKALLPGERPLPTDGPEFDTISTSFHTMAGYERRLQMFQQPGQAFKAMGGAHSHDSAQEQRVVHQGQASAPLPRGVNAEKELRHLEQSLGGQLANFKDVLTFASTPIDTSGRPVSTTRLGTQLGYRTLLEEQYRDAVRRGDDAGARNLRRAMGQLERAGAGPNQVYPSAQAVSDAFRTKRLEGLVDVGLKLVERSDGEVGLGLDPNIDERAAKREQKRIYGEEGLKRLETSQADLENMVRAGKISRAEATKRQAANKRQQSQLLNRMLDGWSARRQAVSSGEYSWEKVLRVSERVFSNDVDDRTVQHDEGDEARARIHEHGTESASILTQITNNWSGFDPIDNPYEMRGAIATASHLEAMKRKVNEDYGNASAEYLKLSTELGSLPKGGPATVARRRRIEDRMQELELTLATHTDAEGNFRPGTMISGLSGYEMAAQYGRRAERPIHSDYVSPIEMGSVYEPAHAYALGVSEDIAREARALANPDRSNDGLGPQIEFFKSKALTQLKLSGHRLDLGGLTAGEKFHELEQNIRSQTQGMDRTQQDRMLSGWLSSNGFHHPGPFNPVLSLLHDDVRGADEGPLKRLRRTDAWDYLQRIGGRDLNLRERLAKSRNGESESMTMDPVDFLAVVQNRAGDVDRHVLEGWLSEEQRLTEPDLTITKKERTQRMAGLRQGAFDTIMAPYLDDLGSGMANELFAPVSHAVYGGAIGHVLGKAKQGSVFGLGKRHADLWEAGNGLMPIAAMVGAMGYRALDPSKRDPLFPQDATDTRVPSDTLVRSQSAMLEAALFPFDDTLRLDLPGGQALAGIRADHGLGSPHQLVRAKQIRDRMETVEGLSEDELLSAGGVKLDLKVTDRPPAGTRGYELAKWWGNRAANAKALLEQEVNDAMTTPEKEARGGQLGLFIDALDATPLGKWMLMHDEHDARWRLYRREIENNRRPAYRIHQLGGALGEWYHDMAGGGLALGEELPHPGLLNDLGMSEAEIKRELARERGDDGRSGFYMSLKEAAPELDRVMRGFLDDGGLSDQQAGHAASAHGPPVGDPLLSRTFLGAVSAAAFEAIGGQSRDGYVVSEKQPAGRLSEVAIDGSLSKFNNKRRDTRTDWVRARMAEEAERGLFHSDDLVGHPETGELVYSSDAARGFTRDLFQAWQADKGGATQREAIVKRLAASKAKAKDISPSALKGLDTKAFNAESATAQIKRYARLYERYLAEANPITFSIGMLEGKKTTGERRGYGHAGIETVSQARELESVMKTLVGNYAQAQDTGGPIDFDKDALARYARVLNLDEAGAWEAGTEGDVAKARGAGFELAGDLVGKARGETLRVTTRPAQFGAKKDHRSARSSHRYAMQMQSDGKTPASSREWLHPDIIAEFGLEDFVARTKNGRPFRRGNSPYQQIWLPQPSDTPRTYTPEELEELAAMADPNVAGSVMHSMLSDERLHVKDWANNIPGFAGRNVFQTLKEADPSLDADAGGFFKLARVPKGASSQADDLLPGTTYAGRGSLWGNPFAKGMPHPNDFKKTLTEGQGGRLYEEWLRNPNDPRWGRWVARIKASQNKGWIGNIAVMDRFNDIRERYGELAGRRVFCPGCRGQKEFCHLCGGGRVFAEWAQIDKEAQAAGHYDLANPGDASIAAYMTTVNRMIGGRIDEEAQIQKELGRLPEETRASGALSLTQAAKISRGAALKLGARVQAGGAVIPMKQDEHGNWVSDVVTDEMLANYRAQDETFFADQYQKHAMRDLKASGAEPLAIAAQIPATPEEIAIDREDPLWKAIHASHLKGIGEDSRYRADIDHGQAEPFKAMIDQKWRGLKARFGGAQSGQATADVATGGLGKLFGMAKDWWHDQQKLGFANMPKRPRSNKPLSQAEIDHVIAGYDANHPGLGDAIRDFVGVANPGQLTSGLLINAISNAHYDLGLSAPTLRGTHDQVRSLLAGMGGPQAVDMGLGAFGPTMPTVTPAGAPIAPVAKKASATPRYRHPQTGKFMSAADYKKLQAQQRAQSQPRINGRFVSQAAFQAHQQATAYATPAGPMPPMSRLSAMGAAFGGMLAVGGMTMVALAGAMGAGGGGGGGGMHPETQRLMNRLMTTGIWPDEAEYALVEAANPGARAIIDAVGPKRYSYPGDHRDTFAEIDRVLAGPGGVFEHITGQQLFDPAGATALNKIQRRGRVAAHPDAAGGLDWDEHQREFLAMDWVSGTTPHVMTGSGGTGKTDVLATLVTQAKQHEKMAATRLPMLIGFANVTTGEIKNRLRDTGTLTDQEMTAYAKDSHGITTFHSLAYKATEQLGIENVFGRTSGGGGDVGPYSHHDLMMSGLVDTDAHGAVTGIKANQSWTARPRQATKSRDIETFREALHELHAGNLFDVVGQAGGAIPMVNDVNGNKIVRRGVNTGPVSVGGQTLPNFRDEDRLALALEKGMTTEEKQLWNLVSTLGETGFHPEDLQGYFDPRGKKKYAGEQHYLAASVLRQMDAINQRGAIVRGEKNSLDLTRYYSSWDVVGKPLQHLMDNPTAAQKLTGFWGRRMVLDEAQDANISQLMLLAGLTGDWGNVGLVGDPKQDLYGWRGGSRYLMQRAIQGASERNTYVDLNRQFRFGAGKVDQLNALLEAVKFATNDERDPVTGKAVVTRHQLMPANRAKAAVQRDASGNAVLDHYGNEVPLRPGGADVVVPIHAFDTAEGPRMGGGKDFQYGLMADFVKTVLGRSDVEASSLPYLKKAAGASAATEDQFIVPTKTNREAAEIAAAFHKRGLRVAVNFSEEKMKQWTEMSEWLDSEASGRFQKGAAGDYELAQAILNEPKLQALLDPEFQLGVSDPSLATASRYQKGQDGLKAVLQDIQTFRSYMELPGPHKIKDPDDLKSRIQVGTSYAMKGLEADFGLVPNMSEGQYEIETSGSVEEARENMSPLYVALTRGKQNFLFWAEQNALEARNAGRGGQYDMHPVMAAYQAFETTGIMPDIWAMKKRGGSPYALERQIHKYGATFANGNTVGGTSLAPSPLAPSYGGPAWAAKAFGGPSPKTKGPGLGDRLKQLFKGERFEDGGATRDQLAMIGEKGREVYWDPSQNEFVIANEPMLIEAKKGGYVLNERQLRDRAKRAPRRPALASGGALIDDSGFSSFVRFGDNAAYEKFAQRAQYFGANVHAELDGTDIVARANYKNATHAGRLIPDLQRNVLEHPSVAGSVLPLNAGAIAGKKIMGGLAPGDLGDLAGGRVATEMKVVGDALKNFGQTIGVTATSMDNFNKRADRTLQSYGDATSGIIRKEFDRHDAASMARMANRGIQFDERAYNAEDRGADGQRVVPLARMGSGRFGGHDFQPEGMGVGQRLNPQTGEVEGLARRAAAPVVRGAAALPAIGGRILSGGDGGGRGLIGGLNEASQMFYFGENILNTVQQNSEDAVNARGQMALHRNYAIMASGGLNAGVSNQSLRSGYDASFRTANATQNLAAFGIDQDQYMQLAGAGFATGGFDLASNPTTGPIVTAIAEGTAKGIDTSELDTKLGEAIAKETAPIMTLAKWAISSGIDPVSAVRSTKLIGAMGGVPMDKQTGAYQEAIAGQVMVQASRSPIGEAGFLEAYKYAANAILPFMKTSQAEMETYKKANPDTKLNDTEIAALTKTSKLGQWVENLSNAGMEPEAIGRALRMYQDMRYDRTPQLASTLAQSYGLMDQNFVLQRDMSTVHAGTVTADGSYTGSLGTGDHALATTLVSMTRSKGEIQQTESGARLAAMDLGYRGVVGRDVWANVDAKGNVTSSWLDQKPTSQYAGVGAGSPNVTRPGVTRDAGFDWGGLGGSGAGTYHGSFAIKAQQISLEAEQVQFQTSTAGWQIPFMKEQLSIGYASLGASRAATAAGANLSRAELSEQRTQLQNQLAIQPLKQANFEIGMQTQSNDLARQQRSMMNNRWLEDTLYGAPGSDQSYKAYANYNRAHLEEGQGAQNAGLTNGLIPTNVTGLENQMAYRSLDNQRAMLVYGQSSLSGGAQFEEQMDYLKFQEDYLGKKNKVTGEARGTQREIEDQAIADQKRAMEANHALQRAMFAEEERQLHAQIGLLDLRGTKMEADIAAAYVALDAQEASLRMQEASIAIAEREAEFARKNGELRLANLEKEAAMLEEQQKAAEDELALQSELAPLLVQAAETFKLMIGMFGPLTGTSEGSKNGYPDPEEFYTRIATLIGSADPETGERYLATISTSLQALPGLMAFIKGFMPAQGDGYNGGGTYDPSMDAGASDDPATQNQAAFAESVGLFENAVGAFEELNAGDVDVSKMFLGQVSEMQAAIDRGNSISTDQYLKLIDIENKLKDTLSLHQEGILGYVKSAFMENLGAVMAAAVLISLIRHGGTGGGGGGGISIGKGKGTLIAIGASLIADQVFNDGNVTDAIIGGGTAGAATLPDGSSPAPSVGGVSTSDPNLTFMDWLKASVGPEAAALIFKDDTKLDMYFDRYTEWKLAADQAATVATNSGGSTSGGGTSSGSGWAPPGSQVPGAAPGVVVPSDTVGDTGWAGLTAGGTTGALVGGQFGGGWGALAGFILGTGMAAITNDSDPTQSTRYFDNVDAQTVYLEDQQLLTGQKLDAYMLEMARLRESTSSPDISAELQATLTQGFDKLTGQVDPKILTMFTELSNGIANRDGDPYNKLTAEEMADLNRLVIALTGETVNQTEILAQGFENKLKSEDVIDTSEEWNTINGILDTIRASQDPELLGQAMAAYQAAAGTDGVLSQEELDALIIELQNLTGATQELTAAQRSQIAADNLPDLPGGSGQYAAGHGSVAPTETASDVDSTSIADVVAETLATIKTTFGETFDEDWQEETQTGLREVLDMPRTVYRGVMGEQGEALQGGVNAMMNVIRAVGTVFNRVVESGVFDTGYEGMRGSLEGFFGGLQAAIDAAAKVIRDAAASVPQRPGPKVGPTPEMARGTLHSRTGWAIVGEAGTELVVMPDGSHRLVKGETLLDLPAGSRVYNAAETSRLLGNANTQEMVWERLRSIRDHGTGPAWHGTDDEPGGWSQRFRSDHGSDESAFGITPMLDERMGQQGSRKTVEFSLTINAYPGSVVDRAAIREELAEAIARLEEELNDD